MRGGMPSTSIINRPNTGAVIVDRETCISCGACIRAYYDTLGWDERGIPTKETLEKLDIADAADSRLHVGYGVGGAELVLDGQSPHMPDGASHFFGISRL